MLTNVYGLSETNNSSLKEAFLQELRSIRLYHGSSWVIMGNFNITPNNNERNFSPPSMHDLLHFLNAIWELHLIDLPLNRFRFSWSDGRLNLKLARLDLCLVSLGWNDKFPNSSLSALEGNIESLPTNLAMWYIIPGSLHFFVWSFPVEAPWGGLVKKAWYFTTDTTSSANNIKRKLDAVWQALNKWEKKNGDFLTRQMDCFKYWIQKMDLLEESRPSSPKRRWLCSKLKQKLNWN